VEREN